MTLEELEIVRRLVNAAVNASYADEGFWAQRCRDYRYERRRLMRKLEDLACEHRWEQFGRLVRCQICQSQRMLVDVEKMKA